MADVFFCEIIENIELIGGVFSITVKSRAITDKAIAGQFLHIKCGHSRILRRPISICSIKDENVNFIFEVKGDGTKWLAKKKRGDKLDILGPLGNGIDMSAHEDIDSKIIVVGGGVRTPPMLFAAQSAKQKVTAILGFRDKSRIILADEFKAVSESVYITTDDGSAGIHGAVTKPLEDLLKTGLYKTVISCGQFLMQKAVAQMCAEYNVLSLVSLEERMGCGIGACLVCACETKTQMSRVCIDGPLFNANDIVWE